MQSASDDVRRSDTDEALILIDGNNLAYRAYFALPNSIRSGESGAPMNAVYGFLSMLVAVLRDYWPCQTIVAFDSEWPTIRHTIDPSYKGGRTTIVPDEAKQQITPLRDILSHLSIPTLSADGYEADDLIATVVRNSNSRFRKVCILSGDRDLMQLLANPNVTLIRPIKGTSTYETLDQWSFKEKFGFPPDRYVEYKALCGDQSDNIRGLPGVGPKTASKIVLSTKSITEPSAASKLGPKQRELLNAHLEQIHGNMKLLQLLDKAPTDTRLLDQAMPQIADNEIARDWFRHHGWDKLYERLEGAANQSNASSTREPPQAQRIYIDESVAGYWPQPTEIQIALVSCSDRKSTVGERAEDLYTSPLFRSARQWATAICDEWYILSAKYGLVKPTAHVEPYDLALSQLSKSGRQQWTKRVSKDLLEMPANAYFVILAGELYAKDLAEELIARDRKVWLPLRGMPIGRRLQWLQIGARVGKPLSDLERFYALMRKLEMGGCWTAFSDADPKSIPEKGVYFLFEPGEMRLNRRSLRCVRVGTHAVSRGSKSRLWTRLRTHRGMTNGLGNHRSSILRSHVGFALMARERLDPPRLPNWGNQAMQPTSEESTLERMVSKHLNGMSFAYLEVLDQPGPRSDRAYIERNSIGLLATVGAQIDEPSEEWLGHHSRHQVISTTGIWNVDHVQFEYDPSFLDVLQTYVSATLGEISQPKASIASPGWWARRSRQQSSLFEL